MVEHPHSNEVPEASSSTAVPAASTTSDNPIVAAAQKAKSAVKKHVARPGVVARPSVRLLHKPSSSSVSQTPHPIQRTHDGVAEETSSGEKGAGWLSIFRKKEAASNVGEKDRLPVVAEASGQSGRKRIMVPRRVAEELAPQIAAHRNGNEDPQALAEYFASHADAYIDTDKEDPSAFRRATKRMRGGIQSLFGGGKYSNENESYSTIQAQNSDEYNSDMVDLLDVIGKYTESLENNLKWTNFYRSPSIDALYANQRSKLTICPITWKTAQSPTCVHAINRT
jgi:hypothetical protein